MKYCDKCKVSVRGSRTRCPLCQNELEGSPTPDVFPDIPTIYKQFALFFKLLMFGAIAAAVICVAINLIVPTKTFWAAFAVLGIACLWLTVSLGIKKRHKIASNITWQVILISLLSIVWDAITGWHGWSIDYVLPIACGVAMLAMFILARVLKIPASEYIICLVSDIVFCIAPLILYLTGALTTVLPSIICIALSVISLAALIVFEGHSMRLELARRLHL